MKLYVEIKTVYEGSWRHAYPKIGKVRRTRPSNDDGRFWLEVEFPAPGNQVRAEPAD